MIPTPSTSLQTKVLGAGKWEEAELLVSTNENKVRGWAEGLGIFLVQRGKCMCVLWGGPGGLFRAVVIHTKSPNLLRTQHPVTCPPPSLAPLQPHHLFLPPCFYFCLPLIYTTARGIFKKLKSDCVTPSLEPTKGPHCTLHKLSHLVFEIMTFGPKVMPRGLCSVPSPLPGWFLPIFQASVQIHPL